MFQEQRRQWSWVRFANIKLNAKLTKSLLGFFFFFFFSHVTDPKCACTQNHTVELFLPPVLSKMQMHSGTVCDSCKVSPLAQNSARHSTNSIDIFCVRRMWSEFLQTAQMAINMIKMSIRKPQWEMRIPCLFFFFHIVKLHLAELLKQCSRPFLSHTYQICADSEFCIYPLTTRIKNR